MARYVIYGAGAVGGAIGATLFHAGHEVVLIARGAHREAMAKDGLHFVSPNLELTQKIPVVSRPDEIDLRAEDRVLLCTKSQDTIAALRALRDATDLEVALFCVQNGVENERVALRSFANVYGVMIISPAEQLSPGVVEVTSAGRLGIIAVGRYPSGDDELARSVADDLAVNGWSAQATAEIQQWKYAKLLDNLSNATQVVMGLEARTGEIAERVRSEGAQVLAKAGIEVLPADTFRSLRRDNIRAAAQGGPPRGSSTWQSLVKGNPLETDYINGEIVLLGRTLGVPTPANALLQRLANETARRSNAVGGLSEEQFLALLAES